MMKMNEKVAKNMRGFMCQSPSATAVCMTSEPLSVIVQKRHDHARLIDSKRYSSHLVEARARTQTRTRGLPSGPGRSLVSVPPSFIKARNGGHELEKPSQLQVASKDQVFQVVVMRVSLHCQGCAGKVKKHLAKMEGVTSFSIDLESKRVTVMGHVSPLGLVESISKVKRAELWPSSSSSLVSS